MYAISNRVYLMTKFTFALVLIIFVFSNKVFSQETTLRCISACTSSYEECYKKEFDKIKRNYQNLKLKEKKDEIEKLIYDTWILTPEFNLMLPTISQVRPLYFKNDQYYVYTFFFERKQFPSLQLIGLDRVNLRIVLKNFAVSRTSEGNPIFPSEFIDHKTIVNTLDNLFVEFKKNNGHISSGDGYTCKINETKNKKI